MNFVCCLEYIEEEEAFTSFHETRYATVGEFSPIIIKKLGIKEMTL
jgi:hypothetical protein